MFLRRCSSCFLLALLYSSCRYALLDAHVQNLYAHKRLVPCAVGVSIRCLHLLNMDVIVPVNMFSWKEGALPSGDKPRPARVVVLACTLLLTFTSEMFFFASDNIRNSTRSRRFLLAVYPSLHSRFIVILNQGTQSDSNGPDCRLDDARLFALNTCMMYT